MVSYKWTDSCTSPPCIALLAAFTVNIPLLQQDCVSHTVSKITTNPAYYSLRLHRAPAHQSSHYPQQYICAMSLVSSFTPFPTTPYAYFGLRPRPFLACWSAINAPLLIACLANINAILMLLVCQQYPRVSRTFDHILVVSFLFCIGPCMRYSFQVLNSLAIS